MAETIPLLARGLGGGGYFRDFRSRLPVGAAVGEKMKAEELRKAVLEIIRDIAGLDETPEVDGAKPLRDQLELDSMDFLDIVMELRKRHKIEVPEADYGRLATLDSTVGYLAGKMA